MSLTVAPPEYPPARLRAAGAFLRQWAVNRYGADKIRGLLNSNLGVTHYRPAFNPSTDYSDTMKPFVDHIVARAREAAASTERYVDNRPVVFALRDVKRKR